MATTSAHELLRLRFCKAYGCGQLATGDDHRCDGCRHAGKLIVLEASRKHRGPLPGRRAA